MNADEKIYRIAYDIENDILVHCIKDNDSGYCKYLVLDDPFSKQLSKLDHIFHDLLSAQKAFNELIKLSEKKSEFNIVYKALYDFTLVTILKCFNSSQVRKTSLDYKDVFKDNDDLMNTFNIIKEIRDSDIAHAGNYSNGISLYFSKDRRLKSPVDIKYSNAIMTRNESHVSFDKIKALIEYTLLRVNEKKDKLYGKLIEELKSKGYEYYFSKSKEIDIDTIVELEDEDGYLRSIY